MKEGEVIEVPVESITIHDEDGNPRVFIGKIYDDKKAVWKAGDDIEI